MKTKITVALILLWALSGFAQSSYDFNRSDTVSLNAVSKWVNIGGMDTTASIGVVSNQGYPYNILGNTYYGGVYWDSALSATTAGWRARIVLKQLPGTNNVKNFYLVVATTTTHATGSGYVLQIQQNTGSDYMYLREFNQWTPIENGTSGYYPDGLSAPLTSDHAVSDTFYVTVYPDGRKTAERKRGSTRDSLTTTDATYNVVTSAYVWLYGRNSTTQILIDDFQISVLSAPAAAVDTVPPVANTPVPSNASPTTSQSFTLTTSLTDNYGLDYTVLDSSQNGSTWAVRDSVKINNGTAVTSYSYVSPSFSSSSVDTIYYRVRVKEDSAHAGYAHFDTSATVSVRIISPPVVSQFSKRVYGYLTFQDTKWAGLAGGTVPADSLPWEILTHVGLFAANGSNPPQSSYINQLSPMATRAHQNGVFAGLTVGGSDDAALVTLMNNPSSWTSWINTYLGYIDDYGIDFLDFDLEGSYTVGNVGSFFAQLKDSLDVRTSDNDPTRAPFIVLTVGMGRSQTWGATASIRDNVDFVNIMSYDFMGDWWGRLIHDCSIKSYTNYDGTGVNTDYYAGQGVNSSAPSMQEAAKRAISGGWPASKVLVGLDANPTYYYSTSATRALYIRQPVFAGLADVSSDLDFSSQWPTMSTWPSDSIQFDQIAQTYWIHTGTDASTDEIWTFTTMPGKDSGVAATRKIVDSMNIGGVMIWNLGNEIWNTSAVPTGGRGWFFSQLRTHFAGTETTRSVLNPPTTFTPANGATLVAVAPTLDWNDVSGATAYHAQVSTAQDFSSVTVKDTSTLLVSRVAITGLANNTLYYYRVRVQNAVGWGAWSSTISFTTVPAVPGAPTLTSPADLATGQPQTLRLFWTVASGSPTHYQLLVDDDVSFSSLFLSDSTITLINRQVSGLANSTTYYWKVRAKSYAGGWGSYSTARSFTTGASIPSTPSLLSPADGATNQSTTPTFSWTRPAGADSFQFQIDSTADFTTPLVDTLTASASYNTATLVSGLTYYWRVYSNGAAGNSTYSSAFSLTIGTDIQPPAPGQQGYYVSVWNPISQKWESKLLHIIESRTLYLSEYPLPLDSNGVTWGPRGWRSFNGDTTAYAFGAGSGWTAQEVLDSLQTLTLDSLVLASPSIRTSFTLSDTTDTNLVTTVLPSNGNSSFTVKLPSVPGSIGVKDNVAETYDIGALTLQARLEGTSGGTYYSGRGGTSQVLLYENDSVNIRQLTTSDISGYSSGSAPTGKTVIDSLNTNTRNDTITTGLTFKDDSLTFINSTTKRGYIYAGTSQFILHGLTGVQVSDNVTGNRMEISSSANGTYLPVFGNNDVFEIQNRASSTVRNDSLFQITDSSAAYNGKPVFQISNFGDLGLYDRTAGSDAFTTTATTDTVTITGASSADFYYITLTGTAAPSANDACVVQATSTGFVLHRSAAGTSGLTYNWLRIKNLQ